MAVVLLLLTVSISFFVVRIGAEALELTGMPWEHAKFQALSAFSTAGFTTAESEEIARHPLRRRIVSALMVLGNAGLVATVGTFAGSILQPHPARFFLNVAAILLGIGVLLWLARHPRLTAGLRRKARGWLDRKYGISEYSPEDLLHLTQGFRLARLEVASDSPAANRSLRQLRLKENTVQILAIERQGGFVPAPQGAERLLPGDRIVVFGRGESIERCLSPEASADLLIVEELDASSEDPGGGREGPGA